MYLLCGYHSSLVLPHPCISSVSNPFTRGFAFFVIRKHQAGRGWERMTMCSHSPIIIQTTIKISEQYTAESRKKRYLSWTNQLPWRHGECGGCVPCGALFLCGMRAREATLALCACHPCPHCCCTIGQTLLEETGSSGLGGSPGKAVVLSCCRAAIFGFPILILKQVSSDSSLLIARIWD